MAIYISGVRNLPEQVQKNKDDIEDLQTADTNLEAKIDQEIADRKALIEANGNATIIENPTENVAVSLTETETNRIFGVFIDGTPKLTIDESSIIANQDTAVNGVLEAHGNIEGHSALAVDSHITAGGDITTAEGNIYTSLGYIGGLVVKTTIINVPEGNHTIQVNCPDSSNVNHILKFDADTLKLTIDGNEVGGKPLYQHNISASRWYSINYTKAIVSLQVITDSNTPFTYSDLAQYLYNKGINSSDHILNASGGYWYQTATKNAIISGVYSSDGTTITMAGVVIGGTMSDTNYCELNISSSYTFNDTIIEI